MTALNEPVAFYPFAVLFIVIAYVAVVRMWYQDLRNDNFGWLSAASISLFWPFAACGILVACMLQGATAKRPGDG